MNTEQEALPMDDDKATVPEFRYDGQQLRRAQLAYTRILQELRDCHAQGALALLGDVFANSDDGDLDELVDVLAVKPAPKPAKKAAK